MVLGGFGSFWVVPCFSNYGSSPALATSRICSSGLFLKSSKTFWVYFGCYNALYNYIRKAEFLSRQTILLVFLLSIQIKQVSLKGDTADVYKTWTPGPWTTPLDPVHGPPLWTQFLQPFEVNRKFTKLDCVF